jgi:rare lipoprotein A
MNDIRVEPIDKGGLAALIGGMFFIFFVVLAAANISMSIEDKRDEIEQLRIDISDNSATMAALSDRLIGIQDALTYFGVASWYGTQGEHGRIGANGKRFNMHAMTAAAKRLPFGSKWRVTRLDTGAWVIVTVTDDGPNRPGRLIDLSFEAARQLGMLNEGLVKVKITPEV